MLLEEIKDPNSVDCLYTTCLTIPEYDENRSLAKKCVWALGAINTPGSKEKLQKLSTSLDLIIKKAAIKQLDYMVN